MTADETADPLATSIAGAAARIESARAKINLALHVLRRRADGYHSLDSLVVFAELADRLTAYRREETAVDLFLDGPFADGLAARIRLHDNLVFAAADALMQAYPERINGGIRIDLAKVLPTAAGIGGGSADAAATLRLLNRIWDLRLSTAQLAEIGADLGADVPVCVLSRPAQIEGIGDRVTPVPSIPAMPILLVNPGVPVATEEVFRRLAPAERSPLPPLPSFFASPMDLVLWLRGTRNDLFEPACMVAPEALAAVRLVASDPTCLFARMSGSGATVFGLFPTIEAASAAAERAQQARPTWWTAVTWTEASPEIDDYG